MLEADGHRVIGIDLRDADVIADLSADEGRADAVAAALDRCDRVLDRLVAAPASVRRWMPDSLPRSLLRQRSAAYRSSPCAGRRRQAVRGPDRVKLDDAHPKPAR